MAAAVVALPQAPEAVLPAHVPDLQVHVGQRDGLDVLADGGHGAGVDASGGGGVIEVEVFDGGEEGRFARVVEAEEEDGVLCGKVSRGGTCGLVREGRWFEEGGIGAWNLPSLLVA